MNWGSSPRLRGARLRSRTIWLSPGIIPALAGSTRPRPAANSGPRDHPRACGEHPAMRSGTPLNQGSSPRLRGAPHAASASASGVGIIPALAGSTTPLAGYPLMQRDHPRACGEHHTQLLRQGPCLGSSPRLRGAPLVRRGACAGRGIIPALAGSTFHAMAAPSMFGDHPRACGEHACSPLYGSFETGSSPRLRGAPNRFQRNVLLDRIIPALAGSTSMPNVSSMTARDHPRACGEHGRSLTTIALTEGSSPRLRGARQG
ncbi:hypothetical protein CGZ88_0859 [Bifidobacterium anseris]|uniref:Uncharacterized protein n=1 Tax=Bifidobacterium anseris TaxID=2020963 RepID=A0A2N5IZF2_9BIFI|nr:hypothetical protein CGZ88_0859 [Bifidobacterium anseris]